MLTWIHLQLTNSFGNVEDSDANYSKKLDFALKNSEFEKPILDIEEKKTTILLGLREHFWDIILLTDLRFVKTSF